jgi:hypothetical protein
MTYSVGNSEVANYANTSSGKVTNVVADNGVGGSGESVNVVDRVALSFVIATDMQYPTINVSSIPGYIVGKSDLTITVNAGVYVYGYSYTIAYNYGNPNPFSATMNILGGTTGDTIKLVNNGYILGAGGDGGGATSGFVTGSCCCGYSYEWTVAPSTLGQAAVEITYPLILENNGYIAGGGGGGAYAAFDPFFNYDVMGGGGGAGGGLGIDTIGVASTRAVPPNVGNNGQEHYGFYGPCNCQTSLFISGGGGGFVLPGVGGLTQTGGNSVGRGGGSGGAGSARSITTPRAFTNAGGTANGNAPAATAYAGGLEIQSGGGGGWGATGANSLLGITTAQTGQPGGNSIITNGNAITTITAGTQYGALRTTGTTYVVTLSSSATQTTVTLPAGFTNAIIIVPTGVTLRNSSISNPALFITGTPVTNLKIIVNGAILGKGGVGGSEGNDPESGGDAIKLANFICSTLTVDCTYGYVAAGGGGGGYAVWNPGDTYYVYGGGGAGGGNSGSIYSYVRALGATTVGASGSNGTTDSGDFCGNIQYFSSGGGGGLIVPGATVSLGTKNTADMFPGIGGSGGGSGAARKSSASATTFTNNGGGFNVIGGTQANGVGRASGGGGGGWGATGGNSKTQLVSQQSGGLGGFAISSPNEIPIYVINPANIAGNIA